MAQERNCVLSIAGFDPSGGAGILADIKTFEAHNVWGMGAVSALTFQNDKAFDHVKWIDVKEIIEQISILKRRFDFAVIKIGLIENLDVLETIISTCQSGNPRVVLIWDPVIKASAGFEFHKKFDQLKLFSLLKHFFLITPNMDEIKFLTGTNDSVKAAEQLSMYCAVLLKGGHSKRTEEAGVDYLFIEGHSTTIPPLNKNVFPKHGSGCVLSSAITANLLLGNDLITSCRNAKKYIEQFLSSHQSLLGIHYVQ